MNQPEYIETAPGLDPILHQPVRTRLVAFLAARGEATFSELKMVLEITDGNLDSHIKKLKTAGYLLTHKLRSKRRPQTLYALSRAGEKAFAQYVKTLNSLLGPAESQTRGADNDCLRHTRLS